MLLLTIIKYIETKSMLGENFLFGMLCTLRTFIYLPTYFEHEQGERKKENLKHSGAEYGA